MESESRPGLCALLGDPAHAQDAVQAVLDTAPDVILLVETGGTICGANRSIAGYFGLTREQVLELTLDELFDRVAAHTDRESDFRRILARIRAQHDLSARLPFNIRDFAFRVVRPREVFLYLYGGHIHNQRGEVIGEIWSMGDVTEIRQTQAKLAQSEKMASLGMLVAGIAHEINTPIGAISSMHDTLVKAIEKLRVLLEDEVGDVLVQNPKIAQTLKIIEDSNRVITEGSSRVTNIVRRLRSFARLDEAELKDADINEGIIDTLTLIQHELKRGIDVVRDFDPLPPISCFPGRLNQVFLNMLMNARQAISGEGEIRVRTRLEDGVVRVSISDTGVGIPPENLSRIFDPGFTTKGVGVGTGLGLSICYQIVEEHHGKITVESELGKGTTFTVEIPSNLKDPGAHQDPAE